jgi:hypothetical protein
MKCRFLKKDKELMKVKVDFFEKVNKIDKTVRHWGLIPAILATQEAEIRRIRV